MKEPIVVMLRNIFTARNMLIYIKLILEKEENTRKEVLIWLIDGVIRVLERITADF